MLDTISANQIGAYVERSHIDDLLAGTVPNGYETYADNLDIAQTTAAVLENVALDLETDVLAFEARVNNARAEKKLPPEFEFKDALEREKSFFLKVYAAVMSMAERQPGVVTALFDIDETITEFTDANGKRIGRPAFYYAVNELKNILGDRLEVGLLTTKGHEEIEAEVVSPTYLKDVPIALDFIFSTKDVRQIDGSLVRLPETNNVYAWESSTFSEVVRPEVLKATVFGLAEADKWFSSKLVFLQALSNRYPERGFVWVDDLRSTSVVRDDLKNAMAVNVHEEIHTATYRNASQSIAKHSLLS